MGKRCSGSAVTQKLVPLLLWPWAPFVREGGCEFRETSGLGHHRAGREGASRWNKAIDRRSQCLLVRTLDKETSWLAISGRLCLSCGR